MPVQRSAESTWPGLEETVYKDEPGTWVGVTRRIIAPESGTTFETRYFDIAPSGYTSYERHGHEHVVIVVKGSGEVRLGEETIPIGLGDVVHVAPHEPHQFRTADGMGIICTVDRKRDRPQLLNGDGSERATDSSHL